jgi:hypothetical protein
MANHISDDARPGKIEEFIQTIRTGKKMKKVKKVKNKDKKDKTREYAFETKKGELFSLIFHPALDDDPNPSCRMRMEIQDENEQQIDPAYDPAKPKLVLKMNGISLWTPDEIMFFLIDHMMGPDQENWNQFFSPGPAILTTADSDTVTERKFKSASGINAAATSQFNNDFFS